MSVLGRRALNRATLARQHLLDRADLPVPALLEHLVGLQAQSPGAPYFGLWTRLAEFRPGDLSALIESRDAVRIALMRSTIHLVTARDALGLRPVVQPLIDRQVRGSYGRALDGLEDDEIARATRDALAAGPLTSSAIGRALALRWPGRDPGGLALAARAAVPMVQVPPRGLWRRSGAPAHLPADDWLGRRVPRRPGKGALETVLLRYLAAFGPATIADAQKWSGLTRLADVARRLGDRLVAFRDDAGRELLDLPDAPRPDPDTPAPPRFLPEFDNLLLSHVDRTRVLPERHAPRILRGGMIDGSVLLDGFVAGRWRLARKGKRTALRVELFATVPKRETASLEGEAAALLAFAAPGEPSSLEIARG